MSGPCFPENRADRTVSVASRFALTNVASQGVVAEYVTGWVYRKVQEDHIDLREDLVVLPWTEIPEEGFIDIIFDGRPGSRRWKDWMVYLTIDLKSSGIGVIFQCFYDRVAHAAHPASLRKDVT